MKKKTAVSSSILPSHPCAHVCVRGCGVASWGGEPCQRDLSQSFLSSVSPSSSLPPSTLLITRCATDRALSGVASKKWQRLAEVPDSSRPPAAAVASLVANLTTRQHSSEPNTSSSRRHKHRLPSEPSKPNAIHVFTPRRHHHTQAVCQ
jgi:hypothetical protein